MQAVVEEVQQQEATAVDAVAVPSQEVVEEAVEMVVEEPKEEELVQEEEAEAELEAETEMASAADEEAAEEEEADSVMGWATPLSTLAMMMTRTTNDST